jgi:hypothetical protein
MTTLATVIGRGTTAAKPAASSVPVGAIYYDTDLGKLQRSNGADWEDCAETADSSSGLYDAYVCIRDEKAQNTKGGTFTSGGWRTRDLTVEAADTANIASLASNQITLEAGTYRCLIACPAYQVNRHQARIQDITAGATLLTGQCAYSGEASVGTVSTSVIQGRFTLAVQSVLEVQHQGQATFADRGFGVECNFGAEVYTVAEFWREA